MMERKILELMVAKIQDRIDNLTLTLRQGNVKDMEEYRYIVGQVRGLAAAQMEADDLLRKLKDIDNDD